mgnify:CR=1 FL=1
MEQYKQEFINFMVESEVLKFGEFTLKSGRKSPFFMNAGAYVTGTQLRRLGEYYAKAIHDNYGLDFDVLFGPAYKGIPLTVAASMALSEHFDADIKYCSNRKEVKDHGDKGILLGSPIADGDKVVIIEDVTTAGTSIEETLPIIKAQGDAPNAQSAVLDVREQVEVAVNELLPQAPGECGRSGTGGFCGPLRKRKGRKICPYRDPGKVRLQDHGHRDHEGSGGAPLQQRV